MECRGARCPSIRSRHPCRPAQPHRATSCASWLRQCFPARRSRRARVAGARPVISVFLKMKAVDAPCSPRFPFSRLHKNYDPIPSGGFNATPANFFGSAWIRAWQRLTPVSWPRCCAKKKREGKDGQDGQSAAQPIIFRTALGCVAFHFTMVPGLRMSRPEMPLAEIRAAFPGNLRWTHFFRMPPLISGRDRFCIRIPVHSRPR
ncbi:hypothetical protein SAMN05216414_101249 [Nitrosovibrio sp. Nv17]|nr:hypothetical protein SAMN05216414_101249 [Nitrosovibrio sp. Nv17]